MSTIPERAESITTLADREVTGADGARPVRALLGDLRADASVTSAEARVETVGEDDDADAEDAFTVTGSTELGDYGYSTRFPFSVEAVQRSGFDADEPVTVYAREDAILLVSNRDDTAPRVREVVAVELDVANVPPSVAEILDAHTARISPESVEVSADGTLAFAAVVPSEFERITERDVRTFGSGQTILTVPKDALGTAGLDTGDSVIVRATPGAVLLIRE